MTNYNIRLETEADFRAVENLVRESFWNVYRPGCTEHYVLHHLRRHPDFIPELSFVMEQNGRLIGQNVFVETHICCDDGSEFPILTMGPICIANDLKRKGYGKILLDYSLQKAAEAGYGAVCFEGNIDFYGKSGFDLASKFSVRYHGLPEGVEADFFLCRELKSGYLKGISGVYSTPKPYFIAEENPEDFEAYDAGFPKMEKLKLPGQLF